ncbi:MAG: DUF2292 domain-containing protein [Candidatus Omnitrophota bacterium]|jgi:hypothetical protein
MNENKNIVNDAIIKDIADTIRDLKFGSVIIKVHNSKIVQIDVSKKSRFDDVWLVEEGGGI